MKHYFFLFIEKFFDHIHLFYLLVILVFLFSLGWIYFMPVSMKNVANNELRQIKNNFADREVEEKLVNTSPPNKMIEPEKKETLPKEETLPFPLTKLNDFGLNDNEINDRLIIEPNFSNSGNVEMERYYFIEKPIDIERNIIDESITFSHKEKIRHRFQLMIKELAKKNQYFESDERIILEELKKLK